MSAANGLIHYQAFQPGAALRPYVHCYWQMRALGNGGADYTHHLVADGSVDLIFDLTGRDQALLSVTGDRASDLVLGRDFHYFGIRFFPACIHCFFNLTLAELTGQTVLAEDPVGSAFRAFEAEAGVDELVAKPITAVETALLARLHQRNTAVDGRFLQSLHRILTTSGNAAIQAEVAHSISARQMRRLFEHYTGLSPKLFSRVTRFQHTLAAMQQAPRKGWSQLFYDYGYYDQAHFIREFKVFHGETPGRIYFSNP
ncbi:MAG: AraC family transcriptional regulator [Ferruginibacter sp.]|nr:AraC family transcriptional regulator [Cytophagales bacterium]